MNEPFIPKADPIASRLLPGYLENRRKELPKLREALEARDFGTLHRLGHNLKGSGNSYGLPPVSEIGERIESAAQAPDAAALAESIDALEAFLARVVLSR